VLAAALLGIAIGLAWTLRDMVVYEETHEFCEITGSWRTRFGYVGRFGSVKNMPSPLEAEAQRRGIAAQHDWQAVERKSRTLFRGVHSLASLLTVSGDWTPEQLRSLSDDQIRRLVMRRTEVRVDP